MKLSLEKLVKIMKRLRIFFFHFPDSCHPCILLEKLETDMNLYKSIKQKRKLKFKMH